MQNTDPNYPYPVNPPSSASSTPDTPPLTPPSPSQPPLPPASAKPSAPNPFTKWLLVALILLILGVALGIGGMVLYQQSRTLKQVDTAPTPTPQASDSATLNQGANPYATWKTYTQKDGLYTFKYPSTWTLKETFDTHPYNDQDTKQYEHLILSVQNQEVTTMAYPFELIGGCSQDPGDMSFYFGQQKQLANFTNMCSGKSDYLETFTTQGVDYSQKTSDPLFAIAYQDSAPVRSDFTLLLASFTGKLQPAK